MLYEIIDSHRQPLLQYKVQYAITIVFIIIMIHIPQMLREELNNTVTITPNSPYCGPA